MSEKFSVVSPRSVFRSIAVMGIVSLLGYMTYSRKSNLKARDEYIEQQLRNETVKKLLESKDFVKVQELYSNLSTNETLTQEARSLLKVYFDERQTKENVRQANLRARNEEEQKRKESELERAKNIEYLTGILSSNSQVSVSAEIDRLKKEKGISDEDIKIISQKIKENSLEGMLESLNGKEGLERINTIDNLLGKYPKYEKAPELRNKQLNEYNLLVKSYFTAQVDKQKIIGLLDGFDSWIRKQDANLIRYHDFTPLFEESREYIVLNRPNPMADVEIGDKIRTVRTMKDLVSNPDSKNYRYGDNIYDLPLGTVLTITSFGSDKDFIDAIDTRDHSFRLIRREIEPILDTKESEGIAAIYRRVEGIKNYVNSIKSLKVE